MLTEHIAVIQQVGAVACGLVQRGAKSRQHLLLSLQPMCSHLSDDLVSPWTLVLFMPQKMTLKQLFRQRSMVNPIASFTGKMQSISMELDL